MATPGTTYFPPTGDSTIDVLTTGYRWTLNADRTLDWAVAGGFAGEFWRDPNSVATYVNGVLTTIAAYANVKFNYVGNYATPSTAYAAGSELTVTLSASTSFFPSASIWAVGFFPQPGARYYVGDSGDVFLNVNSQANYLSSYMPGSSGWALLMHEIGHALGLKHPHDNGGTGRPTLGQIGLGSWDKDYVTVMSYADDYDWNHLAWEPATPMVLDVLALQYLYGKNMATGAGDSVYALTRLGDYVTLWDASGNDTIDVSVQQEGWFIWLGEHGLSALVPESVGMATPLSDLSLPAPTTLFWLEGDYENAIGSLAADFIVGSDGSDRIRPGGGNDTVQGGAGLDTVVLSGTRAQYRVTFTSGTYTVTDTVAGRDATDQLHDVDQVQFADQLIAIADLVPVSASEMLAALGVYRAFYGTSPSSVQYANIDATVRSISVAGYASSLAASFAPTATGTLAQRVLDDFGITTGTLGGGNPSASYTALRSALETAFDAFSTSRGQIVLNIANLLKGLESNAVFGNAARSFNARVAADYGSFAVGDTQTDDTHVHLVGLAPDTVGLGS